MDTNIWLKMRSHYVYEWRMMQNLAQIAPDGWYFLSTTVSNVLMEAFVLHFANLFDFLEERFDPSLYGFLRHQRERAQNEVLALTSARFENATDKQWDFSAIVRDMKPVVEAYLNDMDATEEL